MFNYSTISPSYAISNLGGTWRITNIVTSDPLSFTDLPIKVTYLPYDKVKALHNADLSTSELKDYLVQYGAQALTTHVAGQILAKFGVDLTGLVGGGFVLFDIYSLVIQDSFNAGINTAYRAGQGMVYTVYQAPGGDKFFRCTNWLGEVSMPDRINFKTISGYAEGTVTIGEYNFDIGW